MASYKHIKGFLALEKAFDALPNKIKNNVLPGPMRDAANVYRDEAKAQLAAHKNVVTGELSDGIKVFVTSGDQKVTATTSVTGKHAHVAYWLEFTGASPHKIKGKYGLALAFQGGVYKSVEHPGFAAQPFMRPTFDAKSAEAFSVLANGVKNNMTAAGLENGKTKSDEV